jgi:hypothetical protein
VKKLLDEYYVVREYVRIDYVYFIIVYLDLMFDDFVLFRNYDWVHVRS